MAHRDPPIRVPNVAEVSGELGFAADQLDRAVSHLFDGEYYLAIRDVEAAERKLLLVLEMLKQSTWKEQP